ncbi:MAG: hypothetical protein U1E52_03910 [Geminicoccaceae bacterium]
MLRLGLGMIQAAGEVRALIGCHLEVADPPARHAANFACGKSGMAAVPEVDAVRG